jgi:hypothetical protein
MSFTDPTDHERAELLFECDYCSAAPGQWCRVANGETEGSRATWLHQSRWQQAYEVVQLTGWHEAEREIRDRLYAIRGQLRELINAGSDDAPWLLIRLREVLAL